MQGPSPQSLKNLDTHSRKLPAYYPFYERHFGPLRDESIRLLEIGVQYGGSLSMWSQYFPRAGITGADIDPACKMHARGRIEVKIGDQADPEFLSQFTGYDIIIDDGGHTMRQQRVSFENLFPLLNPGGIYVIEDLHTSYWPEFFDEEPTMMDRLGGYTHLLNSEASRDERARGTVIEDIFGIAEMHFYPSLCFIYKTADKKPLEKPIDRKGGVRYRAHRLMNRLLRRFT